MKVFLVEDDSEIREMETYALTGAGYSVMAFGEPVAFLKQFQCKNQI